MHINFPLSIKKTQSTVFGLIMTYKIDSRYVDFFGRLLKYKQPYLRGEGRIGEDTAA